MPVGVISWFGRNAFIEATLGGHACTLHQDFPLPGNNIPTQRLQEAMNRIEPRQVDPSDGRDNKSPGCLGKGDGHQRR